MSHQWLLQKQGLFDDIRFMWITIQLRVIRLVG